MKCSRIGASARRPRSCPTTTRPAAASIAVRRAGASRTGPPPRAPRCRGHVRRTRRRLRQLDSPGTAPEEVDAKLVSSFAQCSGDGRLRHVQLPWTPFGFHPGRQSRSGSAAAEGPCPLLPAPCRGQASAALWTVHTTTATRKLSSDQPYHRREATVAWPTVVRPYAEHLGLASDPLTDEEGARRPAWARLRSRRARASRYRVRATPPTRQIIDEVLAAYDPGWCPMSHLRHVEGAPHIPPGYPALAPQAVLLCRHFVSATIGPLAARRSRT